MQGPWASLGGYSPSGGMSNQMMGWRPPQQQYGGYGQMQPQAMQGGWPMMGGYATNSGLGGILSGAFGGYGMGRQMMPMQPQQSMWGGMGAQDMTRTATMASPFATTPSFPGTSAVTRAMPWTPPPAQPVASAPAPAPTPAPRQAPKPIAAPTRSTIPQFALADDPALSMRRFMAANRG